MTIIRCRVFSQEFKREAVEKVMSSGGSVSAIATELDVHETVLRRWVAQYLPPPYPVAGCETKGGERLLVHHDLGAENARLPAENQRLRMERETLKKALAIVFAELSNGS